MSAPESGPNAEQASYWNEVSGPKWVALQALLDAQIAPLGLCAIDRAAPRPGERCLDIGCGCGDTSLEIARRVAPDGQVLGVDLSQPMLDRARERAAQGAPAGLGDRGVHFERGDAQIHRFEPGAHDLVFSRFGVMFFASFEDAFANLRRALRPGGRLVFLCWGPLAKNPWVTIPLAALAGHVTLTPPEPGAPGPFALSDPERVRSLLGAAGFVDIEIQPLEREIEVGAGAPPDEVLDFVLSIGPAAAALRDADAATIATARAAIQEAIEPYFRDGFLRLGSATWIVSARTP